MRKTKVKEIKKFVVLASALFMFATGSAFAATTWSDIQTEANSGTAVINGPIQKNDTDAVINLGSGAVPVPTINITGGTNAVIDANGNGYAMINTANTTIENVNVTGANVTSATQSSPSGAVTNATGATLNLVGTIVDKNNVSASNTSFSDNTSTYNGGAVVNSGFLNVNSMQFNNNSSTAAGSNEGIGGAIYSANSNGAGAVTLNIVDSLFYGNTARNFGGAIANTVGYAVIKDTNFISNSSGINNSGTQGGAILNSALMDIEGSNFYNNTTGEYGGAIANSLNDTLGVATNTVLTIKNSNFSGNIAGFGGGSIYNKGSEGDRYNIVNVGEGVNFVNNAVGTVANVGGQSVVTIVGSGGAIFNADATNPGAPNQHDGILNIVGSSSNNVLFEKNIATSGGAIYNKGQANIEYAVFKENGKSDLNINNDAITTDGGAIYNVDESYGSGNIQVGTTVVKNSTFTGNVANRGGAIYNASGSVVVVDTSFDHNSANNSQNGGALYAAADSDTIFRADSKDMSIGYYNSEVDNSVVNAQDTIALASGANASLQAAANKTLNVYSNVYGNGGATVNINNNYDDGSNIYESTGTVRFANDARIVRSNIVLNGGRLSFDHDRNLGAVGDEALANNLTLNGGTLDLLNNEFGANQLYVNNLTLTKDTKVELDVNLSQAKMDSLISGTNVGSFGSDLDGDGNVDDAVGNIIVSAMKSTTDTNASSVDILFTDAEYLEGHVGLDSGAEVIEGPIYKYAVQHNSISHTGGTTGGLAAGEWFNFKRLGNSDAVLAGPVAAQSAFLLMDNIYRQSFANMDMVTLMTPEQRMAWKMRNKYASVDALHRGVYAPNVIPEERDGWYLRPFTNFENVPLKNGPKVSNVFYGTLIGGESDIIDLGKGWDGNFSFFGAYHGSHQAYNGNSIWQNGGSVGGVATAYKGNFFTGITANVGASAARATNVFGSEDFPILMTGAAWKSGYNWGLMNNKLVIQPSYMMSYTFVNVFDYTNSAGVNITQDPLHAMEFIPGIKIIGNLPNGWQPYAAVNMTWIAMDRTKFYANEAALTRLGIKPFVEYGVGLQKRYGDRFTGFGQAMLRNGGRNGIAFTLGMRWALGN